MCLLILIFANLTVRNKKYWIMKIFLPEWYESEAILMALPENDTDWNYILTEALEQYHRIIKTFTDCGVKIILLCKDMYKAKTLLANCNQDLILFIETEYNDTWTRDYGPITILRDNTLKALDFGFNGWGLKFAANNDNLVNTFLAEKYLILPEIYKKQLDFVLEGGSLETDGNGTILTTSRCLCSPNRNGWLNKAEAENNLRHRLGADHVLFLDYGALLGDDTDSHIDTLARLAPENTIIYTGCRDDKDPQFEELLKMKAQLIMFRNASGEPFNLIELPLPHAIYDENGDRLPATYANYLIYNDYLFMPTYNHAVNDNLAIQTVKIAFPDKKVIGIDCSVLIKQHGSLHCATMQLPKGVLNPVILEM